MAKYSVSVLIPMYNRKYFINDCIESVLNQTFKDFEIIIRDDCSTDGVFELVQEQFADHISSGKIKLFRNKKNLGEALNMKKILEDATGKYVTVLHNDDLYLPNALEYLFGIAEKFSADVVHSTNFFSSATDGVIQKGSRLFKTCCDNNPVNQVQIMQNDLLFRFNEWLSGGTFQDPQYNIFNRQFIFENNLLSDENCDTFLFTLKWLMKAKIFVKAPEPVYICRKSSDSQTNERTVSESRMEKTVTKNIALFNLVDKFLSKVEFFRDNKELQYFVKAKIFIAHECLSDDTTKILINKNYADLYNSIEKVFKKHFGKDAVYLALLYHWSHIMQFNKNRVQTILQDCLKILSEEI